MPDSERDQRTGGQWLRSILDYLEFRAGCSWRRLSNSSHRNSPEYLWYLDGIRCLSSLMAGAPAAALFAPRPAAVTAENLDDLLAEKLAQNPRAWLVDELMKADSKLTDRKMLVYFTRLKLARMLVSRRKNGDAKEVAA